jgi:transposase-like protein
MTPRQRQAADLYANGATIADICRTVGCTEKLVYPALKLAGVPLRPKPNVPEMRAKVLRMFRDGMRICDIIRTTGITSNRVNWYLKDEPRTRKTTVAACRASRLYPLGKWDSMTDAAMAIVAAKIKGKETVIACMARLIVQNGKEG